MNPGFLEMLRQKIDEELVRLEARGGGGAMTVEEARKRARERGVSPNDSGATPGGPEPTDGDAGRSDGVVG
jgi:hypothetical protein